VVVAFCNDRKLQIGPLDYQLSNLLFPETETYKLILKVKPGTESYKVGLRDGDVLLSGNGVIINSLTALGKALGATDPGKKFKLVLQRNGSKVSLDFFVYLSVQVAKDGNAYNAGMRSGDGIVSYGGKSTPTLKLLQAAKVGISKDAVEVVVKVFREGKFFEFKLKPGRLGVRSFYKGPFEDMQWPVK